MIPVWHRVGKEDGRAVLSGGKGKAPGRGVWVACLESSDSGQTTLEAVAVDGVEVWRHVCHCGSDRHYAFEVASDYLFGRRKGVKS